MRSFIVFILSVLVCATALIIERLVGIEWNYHPDVVTYTSDYLFVTSQGWEALPNQLYYFVTEWVEGSVSSLIAINIIAYALTNVIISKSYFRYLRASGKHSPWSRYNWLLLIWLLFTPYRLHLAIQGLKDSLIILLICTFAHYQIRSAYTWLVWLPLLLLRIYAFLYAFLFVKRKMVLFTIIIAVILVVIIEPTTLAILQARNEIDMRGRSFDTIPSFSEFGLMGTVIRMLVWPFLFLSGTFLLVSPALLFIPIAIDSILSRLWIRYALGDWGLTMGLILCLMAIAAIVNGFTPYIRYVYPLLIVSPIILMQNKSMKFELTSKKQIKYIWGK